jgi:hypothetical protein
VIILTPKPGPLTRTVLPNSRRVPPRPENDRFLPNQAGWKPVSRASLMQRVSAPPPTVRADDYTSQFDRTSGWTGADGTYSVPLPNGETLWLFSDTFWGQVAGDGSRAPGVRMVNNTIARQTPQGTLDFFHGGGDGNPKSVFTPPDQKGWFWLHDAVAEHSGDVTVVLGQFEKTDDGGPLGFRNTGAWLADLEMTRSGPQVSSYQRLPHLREGLFFGSSVMRDGETTYIYGVQETANRKDTVLARVVGEKLSETGAWEFFDGQQWNPNLKAVAPIADDVSMEYSVHKTASGEYVMTTQGGGLSPDIQLRRAPKPEGPWSEPVRVWTAPEQDTIDIAYNAKAHPELSDERGLLISYNVNSLDWERNLSEADVYRPRFVRVKDPSLLPSTSPKQVPDGQSGAPLNSRPEGRLHTPPH